VSAADESPARKWCIRGFHPGENEQRLYSLDAWQEAPFYTQRERAALEWTEAVTRVAETHVPDEVYEKVRQHFTEKELADLTVPLRPSTPGTD
jgi:alkylhydroperoxidase family enzyme